uniref:HECT-type E3 ubiquitin transferase n=1 Tax=Spongospora subterranea TaxID=70186 RepID=A0A0H5QHN2_9EUKA|eukprot:CRZ01167.1 hypothetical protein [Spongospora subterranea]
MVTCPRCTFICEDGAALCPMCNVPLDDTAPIGVITAPWICPQCTFVNEFGPEKCEACDGPRPAPEPTLSDYQSALDALQAEVAQQKSVETLARLIVELGPPILSQFSQIVSQRKSLDSEVSCLREARYAALQHLRITIHGINQFSHTLSRQDLEDASQRCINISNKALAKTQPCIDLSMKIIADMTALSEVIPSTAARLKESRDRISSSPDSIPVLNLMKPISDCVTDAQRWIDSLETRKKDIEVSRNEIESARTDAAKITSDMEEERLSKAKNDVNSGVEPVSSSDETQVAPRVEEPQPQPQPEDKFITLMKKAESLGNIEKNGRLLMWHDASHFCVELEHILDIIERQRLHCFEIQQHCSLILQPPKQIFSFREAQIVQKVALNGKLVDMGVHLTRMECELSMMRLHQLSSQAITEAETTIFSFTQDINNVKAKMVGLPDYDNDADPWAALPLPVRKSGLVSFCSLSEFVLEQEPLSSRVTRSLLHGHEPCVLKQFDLGQPTHVAALIADVSVRSTLQETSIFIAPINAIFIAPETGHAYIESPIYSKGNAEDWLKSKPEGHEVRHLIILLLRALSALQSRGICHGNLHPRNVLLVSYDFSPVLVDFSRARHYEHLAMAVNRPVVSDTWHVGAMLLSYITDMELIPGVPLGPLPSDTPESVREILDALISEKCSASNALDLTFCSGDIVKEMISARQLIRLTSESRIRQMQSFLQSLARRSHDFLITVERDSILYGMITALETAVSGDLLLNFRTKYSAQSSQGIDQGGLTADLFTEFFLKIVQPSENLFESAPEEDCPANGPSYLPNPQNFSLSFYAAVGKAMCKTLIDGRVVPLTFSTAIMKFFLDIDPDLSDLYDYDRTMANSFRNMMLASTTPQRSLDVQIDMPLPCNRRSYVHEKIKQFLIERRRPQLEALRTGFFTLTGLREQCARLAPEDLRVLICGVNTIDATTLLKEIVFEDAWADSVTPIMMVDVLKTCPERDLRRFLRLCTSLSCLPIGGLQRKITIRKVSGLDRLPVGHTCFHTLDMPDYADEDVVRIKLQIVLSHIDYVGFGYA